MGITDFWGSKYSRAVYLLLLVLFVMALPEYSWAGGAPAAGEGFAGACKNVVGFFKNFETILKIASVSIVTIAVVFAGYQIAFAHKRLSDVAPILIGGLLIGGAATIAGWFVADWKSDTGAEGAECTENTVE